MVNFGAAARGQPPQNVKSKQDLALAAEHFGAISDDREEQSARCKFVIKTPADNKLERLYLLLLVSRQAGSE